MRSKDGMRRPRPVASTSASGERPRTAKKASVSAGRGAMQERTCKSCGQYTISYANTADEHANSQNEVIEGPNPSTFMGLRRPTLIPYEEKTLDAMNRGAIAKRLLNLISLIVVVITLALVAATFADVPASGLVAYAKWLVALLIPLFTMALGYYFGRTQQKSTS